VYVSWSSSSTYGGDSGNRIFVLYWSCSLIRVSVIRGSTVSVNGQLHVSAALSPVKEPQCPLKWRLLGSRIRSGCLERWKIFSFTFEAELLLARCSSYLLLVESPCSSIIVRKTANVLMQGTFQCFSPNTVKRTGSSSHCDSAKFARWTAGTRTFRI
jgi:hypothetical protein